MANPNRINFRNVRSGNKTKRIYYIACSECPTVSEFTSATPLPDQVVVNKHQQWGWVISKDYKGNICPQCRGITKIKPENKLTEVFGKVTKGGKPVPTVSEIVQEAEKELNASHAKTADILDRFFSAPNSSKPASEPAHSPEEPMATPPVAQHHHHETGLSLRQTHELTSALIGIEKTTAAANQKLDDIQAAFMLMTEQQSSQHAELVGLTKQLITAISHIVPAIAKIAPAIADGNQALVSHFNDASSSIVGAIADLKTTTAISSPAQPVEPATPESVPEAMNTNTKAPEDLTHIKLGSRIRRRTATPSPRHGDSISISSSQNTTNPHKYYTQMRLPRNLWESVGFTPDTRILITRDGSGFTLKEAPEGSGVKLKIVTDSRVIVQTSSIGNAEGILGGDVVAIARQGAITIAPRTAAN